MQDRRSRKSAAPEIHNNGFSVPLLYYLNQLHTHGIDSTWSSMICQYHKWHYIPCNCRFIAFYGVAIRSGASDCSRSESQKYYTLNIILTSTPVS
jgi:hypothetical protein